MSLKHMLESDEVYKTVSFVISDPRQPDNPIVYASPQFFQVTGYSREEVLGKNCRLLQGANTSRHAISEIRDAIREERETTVCLLNYRKDGTTFWNAFHLQPVQDSTGQVKFFIGIQCDVTSLLLVPDPSSNLDEAVLRETKRKSEETARRLAEDIGRKARDLLLPSSAKTCVSDSVATTLVAGLGNIDHAFVLTDPSQTNNPMVYCSRGFLKMTGYSANELLGNSCSMLQGEDTDQDEVERIRKALYADPPTPVSAVLKNYRKNGQPFFNALYIAPVNCSEGNIKYFCGVQTEMKMDENLLRSGSTPNSSSSAPSQSLLKLRQRGVIGAVRVATRGLGNRDLARKPDDQGRPAFDSTSCMF